jgi:hypothetical protein
VLFWFWFWRRLPVLPLEGRPLAEAEEGMPEVGVRGWLEVDEVGLLLPVLAVRADAPRKRAFLGC